jgi:APA family basic amino acid/polyamine antiporter
VTHRAELKRAVSLPLLVAYGVGTMVGGGFYALLGRMAHHAGMQLPFAILAAAAVAMLTALSFSELAARLPFSAGESRYVDEAFGRKWLSVLVGWGVIATGVVSAATLSRAIVGFFQDVFDVPMAVGMIAVVAVLTGIAIRGILESVWVAAVITIIEVGGLIWVLTVNATALSTLDDRFSEMVPDFAWNQWSGILVASFLAFYAFIGFEDLVNEAEEVQNPRRNLPRGILLAMLITTVLYVLIGLIAVLAVAPEKLAESQTPLALLVSQQGPSARVMMIMVSMLAGANGALVQIVMSSRVAYGMSGQRMGPRVLATVHPKLQTPVNATLLMGGIILVLALWLPVESLAKITSSIMLVNFSFVNAALVRLKLRADEVPDGIVQYPIAVPVLGCITCTSFLAMQLLAAPA